MSPCEYSRATSLVNARPPRHLLPATALCIALASLCASLALSANAAAPAKLPVPATLTLSGVPPLPTSIEAAARRYADLEGTRFVAWHPRERSMIISQRAGETHQLFLLTEPMAKPVQLTFHADPTRSAAYEPVSARYLVVARDKGGNEAHRLYRLDLDARQVGTRPEPVLLSEADLKAEHWSFSTDGRQVLYATTTLDRNENAREDGEADDEAGADNAGERLESAVHLVNPLDPAQRQTLETLPGRRITSLRFINGGRAIEVRASRGARSTTWRMDLNGKRLPGQRPANSDASSSGSGSRENTDSNQSADADEDDTEASRPAPPPRWLVESDGEFRRLTLRQDGSSTREQFLKDIAWDVERIAVPPRSTLPLPLVINEAGISKLKWFDRETRKLAPDRDLALPDGVIGALRWHRRLPELAFTHSSSQSPGDVHTYDAASGKLTRWTRALQGDAATTPAFARADLIRWKSFDGREISGFRYTPPVQLKGKRPVLIILHGGPSGQSRPGFLGRDNYFINELGMVLIYPNVRGSTGFGRTFTNLDNGRAREDAVKDAGALLDWIAKQPDMDASRVVVSGGSYGGYMSHAIATTYSARIAGSISRVGISHFVSLLTHTESYRRENRRLEYGDERDPDMRTFLDRISPLTKVANIRKPMLISHGRNDPRVPATEALQMAEKVRANGQPVWLILGENEGHGFTKKDNNDYLFYATIAFIRSVTERGESR